MTSSLQENVLANPGGLVPTALVKDRMLEPGTGTNARVASNTVTSSLQENVLANPGGLVPTELVKDRMLEPGTGIEPVTSSLQEKCSAD